MKRQLDLPAPFVPYTVCSSCKKCVEGCPARIDIPKALKIYGQYKAGNAEVLAELNKMKSHGLPIDCIECGACSALCPHEIKIRKIMRELAMIQASGAMINKQEVKSEWGLYEKL